MHECAGGRTGERAGGWGEIGLSGVRKDRRVDGRAVILTDGWIKGRVDARTRG
jgi:hypothetical protein